MQICTVNLGGTSQMGVNKCPLMSMNVHSPENAAMHPVHGWRRAAKALWLPDAP